MHFHIHFSDRIYRVLSEPCDPAAGRGADIVMVIAGDRSDILHHQL